MGRREDLSSILVIGSGPIVIGQACEFDYSGTQACKVLREEGYRVVLANSNPATIMTDPDLADRTYIEPLEFSVLTAIIERERPSAVLATMGGQTALNLAMELSAKGVLEAYGVELIGANAEAISTAEDRERFKAAMTEIGLGVPASGLAHDLDEVMAVGDEIGYPLMVRPSFILGGSGTGIARNPSELAAMGRAGLAASPVSRVLIEASIAGWKEFELEVMRDRADNCVVVCSIENFDPMGVHTGDSITVAPAQTLSDVEYQQMRDAAFCCIRRVGVETGGSNIQFAVDPATGSQLVIEMNPRVSRSSALASKATGFPIAKIAARLAVGYLLSEITNDITGATPASFEPTLDYTVVKIPRWAFEKLPGTSEILGTAMQSVGEVMAIGRSFPEAMQKALRGLETGRAGLNADPGERRYDEMELPELIAGAVAPTPGRPFYLEAALRRGVGVDELAAVTGIDPFFLDQLLRITEARHHLEARARQGRPGRGEGGPGESSPAESSPGGSSPGGSSSDILATLSREELLEAKRLGFSDAQLGYLLGATETDVRDHRLAMGLAARYKTVDTCAGEFAAETPYHYSSYEDEDEVARSSRRRIIILGSGPNRIGQGIEFDYCCVHASLALRAAGYETVMVNCNPETVSTDYDTSDRLYFESLTVEDVLGVIASEQSASSGRLAGIIVSLGGQTPLKLAGALPKELVLGTSAESIDVAEDRERWSQLCRTLGISQPPGAMARSSEEALAVADRLSYPLLVRPSYVLGGRAMEIVYTADELVGAMANLAGIGAEGGPAAERPVLIDRFLEDAIEVDVDAVRDRDGELLIGGVMEHVEEAGVHSGDSTSVLPPPTLRAEVVAEIERTTGIIADALRVVGPLNVQFAVQHGQIFVIEANPRASRTVPFVSKATGVPLAKVAARLMAGATLCDLGAEGLLGSARVLSRDRDESSAVELCRESHRGERAGREAAPSARSAPDSARAGATKSPGSARGAAETVVAVKAPVLPFDRFPGFDRLLGPEMRSTGEVMGIDATFGLAFAKSQIAAGNRLPTSGVLFLSLADRDKESGFVVAEAFVDLGFELAATEGTARFLEARGRQVQRVVAKLGEPESRASEGVRSGRSDQGSLRTGPAMARTATLGPATDSLLGEQGAIVDALELIGGGSVSLVINTPRGRGPRADGSHIRRAAADAGILCLTTVAAGRAAAAGIADLSRLAVTVLSLQERHERADRLRRG